MSFVARNHPQQVHARGARDDIDDRGTTPEIFDPLNGRFCFTLDVAAAAHNAKCAHFYDRDADGLTSPWGGHRVWCNPPYSSIEPWVRKAWAEVDAELVVMLLPANRTEQRWWQELVEPHRDRPGSRLRTEFLSGRLRFIMHGRGHVDVRPNERPPFGCCLLIWTPA